MRCVSSIAHDMKHRARTRTGFTLIETLLYIALFGIVIVGIVASAYVFFETGDRNQTKAMLQAETDFLIGKIDNALDGAQTIATPAPNTNASMLDLTKYDGTNVTITLSGGTLAKNGIALSNDNIAVTGITFIHSAPAGGQESVEAGIALTTRMSNGMFLTRTASTTRSIRK